MLTLRLVALALASASVSVHAIQKISRAGKYLYGDDGNRFFIKGMSYQEPGTTSTTAAPGAFPEPTDFTDPLADASGCARDLPFMQQLGINTIRVYSVNASLNHDACMKALSAANIYTIIDLSLPVNGSLDRASPSWTSNLLNLYIGTIEVFSQYDNVLAFNVGNEVANNPATTNTGPYIKAATRDVKAYLKSKGSSALVGYAAVDGTDDWRFPLAQYLSCGSEEQSLDLYGLNNYRWCGSSNFDTAYSSTETAFANYNIPAYFSEYGQVGCAGVPPRPWTEVGSLFSAQMAPVWSGGLAFSYFPTVDGFGMVNISSDGKTVTVGQDFNNLKAQYAAITSLPNTPSKSAAGTTTFPTCPGETASLLASTTLPPTPNSATCDCVAQSFSCLFTPQTANTAAIIGDLLNFGCQSLGSSGGTCDAIGGSGQNGTYGALSGCDPSIKLSYVMSSLYESTNRNTQTCNFNGNATINHAAPATRQAAQDLASKCLSDAPASTYTPTSVSVLGGFQTKTASGSSASASGTSGSGSGSGGKNSGAGAGAMVDSRMLMVGTAMALVGVASGMWMLV